MEAVGWITVPVTLSGTVLAIFFKINSSRVKSVCREIHSDIGKKIESITQRTDQLAALSVKLVMAEKKIDELTALLQKGMDQLTELKVSLAERKRK